jgi:hypothetical protein
MSNATTLDFIKLLAIVRQLPEHQLDQLLVYIKDNRTQDKTVQDKSPFQELLLSAPVMTDTQYQSYLELRKSMTSWRTI